MPARVSLCRTRAATIPMQPLSELRFKPDALARYGLPDIAYPLPVNLLAEVLAHDGELPLAAMLHGLQLSAGREAADWRALEPALDRLAQLLAPDDTREKVSASSDEWWLEIGPVDLGGKLVTLQRGSTLIAAIEPREDGRLRVAAYRPLDERAAALLTALSRTPHPVHGVNMRENNWEYALDCSAANGNHYSHAQGVVYLSFWEKGLGVSWDGSELAEWKDQCSAAPRRPALVATELGVHHMFSEPPDTDDRPTERDVRRPESAPAWRGRRQRTDTVRGRFLGCLLGGAVGDALGAPVEFMKRPEILARFGRSGLRCYAPAYGGLGRITDDTQMTLFTAEGLLRGWVRGRLKGTTDYPTVTAFAYLRWLHTQGERPHASLPTVEPGWLIGRSALHSRRGPGNTCLSALRAVRTPGMPADNGSKGCGGVMRVAPVGLFGWALRDRATPSEVFRLASDLAALTHGHPTGSLAAGVLAVLVMALVDGATLEDALAASKTCLRQERGHEETLHALERAEQLSESGMPHLDALRLLGEGWVAEEALAISIYCTRVARNFRHGVLLAVNHDGDSDSTGAITGNLLGAMLGVRRIPGQWLEPLELRETISEVALDLHAFRDWPLDLSTTNDERVTRIWEKYPGV